jgi:RNA polymerase subunit RPABC4/transcription elongation factor Spt4
METPTKSFCPQCGEPINSSWRICPMCETRLITLTCYQCKNVVNENWRRCPECEALLVCRQCGTRIMPGQDACPRCQPPQTDDWHKKAVISDALCGIEFVLVRGGTYAMGDTLDQGIENEKPIHQVSLDDFYISRFPVIQAQWSVLMKSNPSGFQHPDHPVEQVTWSDVSEFARKLSLATQKDLEFMLPTEAQWEYAARSGGLDDLYAGGNDIDVYFCPSSLS